MRAAATKARDDGFVVASLPRSRRTFSVNRALRDGEGTVFLDVNYFLVAPLFIF